MSDATAEEANLGSLHGETHCQGAADATAGTRDERDAA
jgi:hypothetical protein